MATLMQPLTAPEPGYKRIDNKDTSISYVGTWGSASNSSHFGGDCRSSNALGNVSRFKFTGDKIRLIALTSSSYSPNGKIKIDGNEYTINFKTTTTVYQALVFDLIGLDPSKEHVFELYNADTANITIDAIDIADTGTLLQYYPPFMTERFKLSDLINYGDYIRGEFISSITGVLGMPCNLGEATKPPIPSATTDKPDGSLAWVYIADDYLGNKILMADRIVQNNVSWRMAQYEGLTDPVGMKANKYLKYDPTIPTMLSASQDGITVSGDGTSATGNIYSIFDDNHTTHYSYSGAVPAGAPRHFIDIEYPSPVVINAIMNSSNNQVTSYQYGIKYWKLKGSNDNKATWVDIADGYHANNTHREFDEFDNVSPFKHYRFEWESWHTTVASQLTAVSITDLQLYVKKPVQKYDGFNLYMRLPNRYEYEKYILKNTFNGQSAPGDPGIWNLSTSYSWLHDGYSSYRYVWNNAATFGNSAMSTAAAAYGIRPMLIVESIYMPVSNEFRVLVQDGTDDAISPLKKYNATTGIWDDTGHTVNSIQPTDFAADGMSIAEWDVIPKTAWSLLSSKFQVMAYSPQGNSRSTKTTYIPKTKQVLMTNYHKLPRILNVDDFHINAIVSGNAQVRLAISPAPGHWHVYTGTAWQEITSSPADMLANGMTIAQFNSIGNAIFDILTADKEITIGFVADIIDSADILEIDNIGYQYDEIDKWQECYKGTEYDVVHVDSETVEVIIYIPGNVKINIMV